MICECKWLFDVSGCVYIYYVRSERITNYRLKFRAIPDMGMIHIPKLLYPGESREIG